MYTCTGDIALPPISDLPGEKSRRLLVGATVALLALGAVVWSAHVDRSALPGATIMAPRSTPLGAGVEYADFRSRASHNGRYRAAVVDTRTLGVGHTQSWTVRISGSGNRPVGHARLAVRTWMPETGEISSAMATAHDLGGGRYVIDNLTFSRAGWWNVALVIDGAAGTDSLAFNVRLR